MVNLPAAGGHVLVLARCEKRHFLAALLREHGCRVREAGTAALAALEIDGGEVDLVVLEQALLADLPGLALAEAARVRCIALLAIGDSQSTYAADVVPRPGLLRRLPAGVSPGELLAAVDRLLAARRRELANTADRLAAFERQIREQVHLHWAGLLAHDIEETLTGFIRCCALLAEDEELQETAQTLLADIDSANARAKTLLLRLAAVEDEY